MMQHRKLPLHAAAVVLLLSVSAASLPEPETDEKPRRAESFAKAIARADTVEVFSILPDRRGDGEAAGNGQRFHGWKVLGRTKLRSRNGDEKGKLESILKALSRAIIDPPPGAGKGCTFEPRHGLRIAIGEKRFDLVVCVTCGDVDIFPANRRFWLTSETTPLRDAMNLVLKDAGVELARGAD